VYGELGDGTLKKRPTPVRVRADATWSHVSTGGGSACGIRTDGSLWCWGRNRDGELGDGTRTRRVIPVQIGTETSWASVSAGGFHPCGIRTTGTLWCWGANLTGQVGDGTTVERPEPVQVGSATTWETVSAGHDYEGHTCGVRAAGSLWCWGYNGRGHLGDGTDTTRVAPTQVGVGTEWAEVSAGLVGSCGLSDSGTASCWGDRLGVGSKPPVGETPVP
jgi:hypothetical protein